ncbi:hypothetical protein [Homoserinimonas aerilata]|uniref:hypothetical protein n=1 Tax=Homoserinimonas aerilata TaxID=1162970 RepID=UPI001154693E|nr:hypothetical protein [Homoserinimonas aerilata]
MGFSELIERLNARLRPYIGSAPLGPYNEAPLPAATTRACPLCGIAMSKHEVERRDGRPTKVHCPTTPAE